MKSQPGMCRICSRKLATRSTICRNCRRDEKDAEAEREIDDMEQSPPNQSLYERIVNELDNRDEE